MATVKRILIIITQSELGGAQQFLGRLLHQMNRDEFEITVGAGVDGTSELKQILPEYITYLTLNELRRDPRLVNDIKAVMELKEAISRVQPDLVLLVSSKAGFIGSLAARLLRGELPHLTVIYRIGGWTFNDPWPRWKKTVYRILERRSASWKDYIVVNSASDLADARRYGIMPRKELLLIHNGIDPYMGFPSRAEARLELSRHVQLPENTLVVGTIANFYATKGLSFLLRAIPYTDQNIHYVIIGDGRLRSDLEKEMKELGIAGRVHLLGRVPEAHALLPAFDMFVLPSIKEGFPWTILEAMAAKVPVIATTVGAVPEIIIHGQNGLLVEPGEPQQLGQAVTALAEDEAGRNELTMRAHQAIIKNFSLRPMVEKYEQLFRSSTS